MMNSRDDEHHVRQAAKSFIPDISTRKGFLCIFANTIINHPLWIIVLIAVIFVFPTTPTIAQTDQRCFPETSQCIAGPIRVSWERGGGLTVFGFPITAQTAETVEGRTLQVQWFERDRLEIQPDGAVTAGRLGAERLEQLGTPWTPGPNAPAGPRCTTFPETGHQLCEPFATFWRKNGGLARFGLPLTDAFETTLEGKPYTVQYFERRRFELHPEVGPNAILLGLLGREVFTARQAPTPAPQPTVVAEPTPVPGPTIQPPQVLDQYRANMPSGFWQVNQAGIQFTATGFEYRNELNRFAKAGPGFKYVVFALEVVNTGYHDSFRGDTFFANSASFNMIDLDGNTHDIDSGLYSLDGYFRGGTFYQGTKSSGTLVFRIPEGSAPARLIYGTNPRVELDFRVAPTS